jgi:N utilization substance protein A
MKSEFLLAITQLSAEKNLPREVVIAAVESALVSAYRKDNFAASQNIEVKINPVTGKVEVWAEKIAVEKPSDSRREVSIEDARQINPDVQIDEAVMVEVTPSNAGRIAAQTAKQVILQRLHEAEHSAIFEEYAGKEGDIVNGVVQRIEPRQVLIDLGRAEAILPAMEQMPNERYRVGQRLKVYLLEVVRTSKGPRVVVSRSHPDLLRRLFEMEVPEVFNGTVEIKSIAREAGYRSKVAVAADQEGIDPVGCCVGLRGIRIQNIVNELNGEKIDVVMWSSEVPTFIANALSPAQILAVELNQEEGVATVVVPDKQLSLAIGKEGQNARLSAKLTGWRVDIKSASVFEVEKEEAAKVAVETKEAEEAAAAEEEPSVEVAAELEPEIVTAEAEEVEEAEKVEAEEPVPAAVAEDIAPAVPFEPQVVEEKAELRFAEDITGAGPPKSEPRSKKKKKKGAQARDRDEDGIRLKRVRRQEVSLEGEDEDEF